MPLGSALERRGTLTPSEVELLGVVFEKTKLPGDTPDDLEARALAIIQYYENGLRTEAELLKAIGSSH